MNYIIGDVHGNIELLRGLILKLDLQKEDSLIFLGDYVDKNPNTKETIDFLNELKQNYQCIFLKGNHDYVWQQYLIKKDFERQKFILEFGGTKTLENYSQNAETLVKNNEIEKIKNYLKDYLEFLVETKDYYIVSEYIAIHGGITREQLSEDPLKIKELNYFLRLGGMDLEKKYLNKYTVVAGHTYLGQQPTVTSAYINIDLGAGYGKYLAAFCVENKEVIRSDGKRFKALS